MSRDESLSAVLAESSNERALKEVLEFVDKFDSTKADPADISNVEIQLHRLKALGRDAAISNTLTPEIADNIVNKFIVTNISKKATVEAFTIIANGLVLNTSLLGAWNPSAAFPIVLSEYAKDDLSLKESYLFGRLLFLFTFNGIELPDTLLTRCIEVIDLKMNQVLGNIHTLTSTVIVNPLIRLSFIELMKFIFNLVHHYPDQTLDPLQHTEVITRISHVFLHIKPRLPENVDITRYILHTLMCVPIDTWFGHADHRSLILENLFEYCHLVTSSPEYQNEHTLSPCLTCLQKIVSYVWETLPDNSETQELKRICRQYLYPSEKDRELSLGKSDSLASNLTNLENDITLQTCNCLIQEIYLIIFDRNQQALTDVMGFGFASRFLVSTGFLDESTMASSLAAQQQQQQDQTQGRIVEVEGKTPESLNNNKAGSPAVSVPSSPPANSSTTLGSDSTAPSENLPPVNPVTGQYLHTESQDEKRRQAQREWDAMTEEEKEREGERMFTLFERLKKNGIIKVSNPLEMAAAGSNAMKNQNAE